jgi:hypothetical protein
MSKKNIIYEGIVQGTITGTVLFVLHYFGGF